MLRLLDGDGNADVDGRGDRPTVFYRREESPGSQRRDQRAVKRRIGRRLKQFDRRAAVGGDAEPRHGDQLNRVTPQLIGKRRHRPVNGSRAHGTAAGRRRCRRCRHGRGDGEARSRRRCRETRRFAMRGVARPIGRGRRFRHRRRRQRFDRWRSRCRRRGSDGRYRLREHDIAWRRRFGRAGRGRLGRRRRRHNQAYRHRFDTRRRHPAARDENEYRHFQPRYRGRGRDARSVQKNFRNPANTVRRGPNCGANTPTPLPERIS